MTVNSMYLMLLFACAVLVVLVSRRVVLLEMAVVVRVCLILLSLRVERMPVSC